MKLGNNFTWRVKLFPNFTCHHLITHTNCLMYADDLEGLQHLRDVIYTHAQKWKLKVNTKKLI